MTSQTLLKIQELCLSIAKKTHYSLFTPQNASREKPRRLPFVSLMTRKCRIKSMPRECSHKSHSHDKLGYRSYQN